MPTSLRTLLATSAAVATLAALAACAPSSDDADTTSLTLGIDTTTYGLIGSPLDGLNLQYYGGKATYEGLLRRDPTTSEYLPLLAEEYELSEDRKSMTVKLREDVDFTDGVHMDAQAVADYCALLFASDGYFHKGLVLDQYGLSVEAIGEYELRLTTTESMDETFFNSFMLWTGIASPESAADREGLKEESAGTGPYVLDEFVPEVSLSYVRNPDYWDPDAFDFDTLTYLVFEDDIAATNALKAGQIDAARVATASLLPDLESEGFVIERGGGTYRTLVITDFTGEIVPALGDVRVRQAIAMAFDQEAIVESLELGYAKVGDQTFSPNHPEYVEGADDRYPYDLEAARELMAEAGYADGFDVVIPSAEVAYYPIVYEPIVQQSLADIGIRVTFDQKADSAGLIEAWLGGSYAIHFTNLGYHQTISSFRGENPALGGHFADDATFNELTTTIRNAGAVESAEASAELGEYLLEESWLIPISHVGVNWAMTPELDITLGQFTFYEDLRAIRAAD